MASCTRYYIDYILCTISERNVLFHRRCVIRRNMFHCNDVNMISFYFVLSTSIGFDDALHQLHKIIMHFETIFKLRAFIVNVSDITQSSILCETYY